MDINQRKSWSKKVQVKMSPKSYKILKAWLKFDFINST